MAQFATENIRTLALVGHGASGKTTLAEALPAEIGLGPGRRIGWSAARRSATRIPSSAPGSTRCAPRFCTSKRKARAVHMIDTPGFPDFIGQSIGALDAVETAAVVINASSGIEMIASRMMDWAAHRKLCRLIIVNKIDAENVDLPRLLSDIQAAFGRECLPINLPSDNGRRVVDCFFNPAGDSDFSSVADAHRALVDQVVEVDEELMSLYLEQGEISADQLHAPFEKALREGHLVPVCFVSRERHGRPGAAGYLREAVAEPVRRQPAAVHQRRGRPARSNSIPSRTRRSMCSRTYSRW